MFVLSLLLDNACMRPGTKLYGGEFLQSAEMKSALHLYSVI